MKKAHLQEHKGIRCCLSMGASARVRWRGRRWARQGRMPLNVTGPYLESEPRLGMSILPLHPRTVAPRNSNHIERGGIPGTDGLDGHFPKTRNVVYTQPKRAKKSTKGRPPLLYTIILHVQRLHSCRGRPLIGPNINRQKQWPFEHMGTCLEIAMAPGLSQCFGRYLSHRRPSHTYLSYIRMHTTVEVVIQVSRTRRATST